MPVGGDGFDRMLAELQASVGSIGVQPRSYLPQADAQPISSYLSGNVPLPRPRQETLMGQAKQQYPILNNYDIGYKYNPGGGSGYLEYWPQGETGTPGRPRPKEFGIGEQGVEVYDPKTRPIDILGDVTSHQLINSDPKVKQTYQEFVQSLEPWQLDRLKEQYAYAQKNFGEDRPYDDWANISGLPGYFRGYPFQQWDNAEEMYTPGQLKKLDGLMQYLRRGGQ